MQEGIFYLTNKLFKYIINMNLKPYQVIINLKGNQVKILSYPSNRKTDEIHFYTTVKFMGRFEQQNEVKPGDLPIMMKILSSEGEIIDTNKRQCN